MNLQTAVSGPVPLLLAVLSVCSDLRAGDGDYKSEFFEKTRLVYSDTFDGKLNTDFWEVRQSTSWAIVDGVLVGKPSSEEFQAKKKASADPSHAGVNPVIWLKQIPENFVCTMRLRYSAKGYQKGRPLLDVGHHIHTISFEERKTTLTIKKDVESLMVDAPLFTLNQWHTVAIEMKRGAMILTIDGVKHTFQSSNIDMSGQHQIDFKGVDFGGCEIDDVKLWEGL